MVCDYQIEDVVTWVDQGTKRQMRGSVRSIEMVGKKPSKLHIRALLKNGDLGAKWAIHTDTHPLEELKKEVK